MSKSFEENLKRIDEIVTILENGENTLDDSSKLFEECMELIKLCESQLNHVEDKINKIIINNNKTQIVFDDLEME